MTDKLTPSDQENRQRIENDLDSTLFVEAGAGTGKTRELVWRIARLIMSGKAEIERIAAITFTEAAAAELRDRVRAELEERACNEELHETERKRCRAAVSGMDSASIQTLHSFAAALLREKPFEAGLPPNFKVVADIEENIGFEEHWKQWLDECTEHEQIAKHLFTAMTMGLRLDAMQVVAKSLDDNYDLLPQRFEQLHAPSRRAVTELIAQLPRIRSLVTLAKKGMEDPLAQHAQKVIEIGDIVAPMDPLGDTALVSLANFGQLSYGKGSQKDWNDDPTTGINGCKELKDLLGALELIRRAEVDGVRAVALTGLLNNIRDFILRNMEERGKSGKAQFHDLLVWARDLLRDHPSVREHFQNRFTHILIDEFQDTDPIQAKIAFFLAADRSAMGDSALEEKDWKKLRIAAGKLFVVGDPKQSIYRFRRADIATVHEVSELLGAGLIPLHQNFRSQKSITSWVNSIFQTWMGAGKPRIQAAYSELTAWHDDQVGRPPQGVHKFGEAIAGTMNDVKKIEASSVVNVLRRIKASGWKVRVDSKGTMRTAEFKDICILMPTRNRLPFLERALDDVNVPYRVESESFVLGTQDVRELLNCLRAIDSPADRVALVAAVRSTAFGCSDVELVEFLDNGGNLDYTDPGRCDGPVRDSLNVLANYNRDRIWMPMDKLIEKFIRERCLEESSLGRARPRERLRRLKLVVEQARAFAQIGESSLRVFADWMDQQAEEGARMVEIPVPETDEDAIRIMTIHAAKGLEFPIVVLMGIGSTLGSRVSHVIFDRETNAVHVSVGTDKKRFATPGYETAKQKDKEADDAENLRLMYVATTRAKDHLVLSLFRRVTKSESKVPAAVIERIAAETGSIWHDVDCSATGIEPIVEPSKPDKAVLDTAAERDRWISKRAAMIKQASRRPAVAATEIAHIEKTEAEDGDVYYRSGRGSTHLGRAVHSVLQIIDLATVPAQTKELEQMSKAQATAEGIPDKWEEVVKLVLNGMKSSVVKRAVASGKYYREVFVSAPVEGGLVEGFIDLLFEEGDGLVIADYKTDVLDKEGEEMKGRDRYSLQAGAYALAVTRATGMPVKEVVLIFLRSGKEVNLSNIKDLQDNAFNKAAAILQE